MNTYREIVFFLYGLVFFELGLAIALQSRNYSRLELAHSLKWLALFGITHGIHEWGDILIAIEMDSLPAPVIQFLRITQLILLAASFAFLFEFGLALLRPFGRPTWMYGLSLGLFIAWMVISFFIILPLVPDPQVWRNSANALARYFIGFPGGLLAAFGLYEQARYRIDPVGQVRFLRALQFASFALGGYAILAGLIPQPIPFFPGNLLNTASFQQWAGLPPYFYRSFIGLFLTIAVIRGLEIFNLETQRLIETMEQEQIRVAERERIARDLHDGVIQKVYTAGLLVEATANQFGHRPNLAVQLNRAVSAINDAISDLRRSLTEMDDAPSVEPLETAIYHATESLGYSALVDVDLKIDLPGSVTLSPIRTGHMTSILSEALSNAVRHGNAHRINIQLNRSERHLDLVIEDDGAGIPNPPVVGYGLRNMHDRARLLGGQISIEGKAGKGTCISLRIPLEEER